MEKQKTTSSKLTRKSIYAFAIVGGLVSMTALTAAACGRGGGMSPKMMERMFLGHVDDVMDEIDATDAQRAKFEATAKDILADGLVMRKAHKQHRQDMLKLMNTPKPDRAAVKTHIQDKIDSFEDFALRTVDKLLDAYETLDSGQRQILLDKLEKHMEKH